MRCCPLSSGDGEGPSFVRTEMRKAAKTHVCCECDEPIEKGSKYEYTCGKWDRDISTLKTCLSCMEIRKHFGEYREQEDESIYCTGGWVYASLWNDLEENLFPAMTAGGPCFEGLSPAAKNRLFEKRMAWLEKYSHHALPAKLYAPWRARD